ncbi:MAG: hypothetical protein R3E48_13265 [Burkholderiaceae bacterium]
MQAEQDGMPPTTPSTAQIKTTSMKPSRIFSSRRSVRNDGQIATPAARR